MVFAIATNPSSCTPIFSLLFFQDAADSELVKSLIGFTTGVFLALTLPAQAAFPSLYVWGDGISTTTSNAFAGSLYFGQRLSNGRVWVEVLAQRQGISYDSNKNVSYFGNTSSNVLK